MLPIDRDYREHSLIKLTQEVALGIERQRKLSQTSTGMYDRLLSLFQIVDRGDAGLAVPRYNGGLFHFDFYQTSDKVDYRANHFLSQFKISDAFLAPVLDRLARFEGQPIDYSFLGVRQLGSIYEGLLEYHYTFWMLELLLVSANQRFAMIKHDFDWKWDWIPNTPFDFSPPTCPMISLTLFS